MKQIKNHIIILPTILAIVALSLVISIPSAYATLISESTKQQYQQQQQQQQPMLYVFSTRNVPDLNPQQIIKQVDYIITKFNASCPTDIAMYIHGFNRDKDEAGEEFNRIQTSFNLNNSTIPLIGFSWNSKTEWDKAKVNAINSGGELAK